MYTIPFIILKEWIKVYNGIQYTKGMGYCIQS